MKIADEERNLANLRNLLLQYQQNVCEDGTEALLNEIYSALEKSVQTKNIELSEAVKQTKYKVSIICVRIPALRNTKNPTSTVMRFLISPAPFAGCYLCCLNERNEVIFKVHAHIFKFLTLIRFYFLSLLVYKMYAY